MTTSQPPNHPPDDAPLPGEEALRARYGQLPRSEPDAALDAAILRAAAQAIADEESPHARRYAHDVPAAGDPRDAGPVAIRPAPRLRKAPRWLVGLGTAATLLLAGSIAWRMRDVPTEEVIPLSPRAADVMATPAGSTPNAASVDGATDALPRSAPAAVPAARGVGAALCPRQRQAALPGARKFGPHAQAPGGGGDEKGGARGRQFQG